MNMLQNFDFSAFDLLDIVFVAFIAYWVLRLIQGTRALYMLVGLGVGVFLYWLSALLELFTLHWLLSHLFKNLLLIVIVLFQSDIRRLLTQIGRSPLFSALVSSHEAEVVEELVRTCVSLANKKIGALVVLEREANVMEYLEAGITLDAQISKELITSVFLPVSPIHDGAIVIQKGRLVAAGCFLPLTMNPKFGVEYGTRHRAALGLTEETDALVIVVSEEKGWISLCADGKISRGLDGHALRKLLVGYLKPEASPIRKLLTQLTRFPGREAA